MSSVPVTLPIEQLMNAAWPGLDVKDTGAWLLRAAEGVTQRANSVWPRTAVTPVEPAIEEARLWYRDRKLPLIFQLTDSPANDSLNKVLDGQRYTRQSETIIMVKSFPDSSSFPDSGAFPESGAEQPAQDQALSDSGAEFSSEPSEEWMDLWWSVDGRGGAAERAIARRILTSSPSVYALVREPGGAAAAVGRLALGEVEGHSYGGLYSLATYPEFRRQGHARRVLEALTAASQAQGHSVMWLLVTAANQGAQALYTQAGFVETGRYIYRQAPLRMVSAGC
ncbi:GNAT family N-acetyltransferase [Pseudarthrobacter sp. J1738]|uniref:GNAT family N-acetyltransferase n=1 Tax=Pseudarthrobacter sp. J1738 TaxID=3420446 RepID=UPI003D2AEDDD